MADEAQQGGDVKWLVILIAGAFLLGLVVYLLNPDYRFNKILESNQRYYSQWSVENPTREGDDEEQENPFQ